MMVYPTIALSLFVALFSSTTHFVQSSIPSTNFSFPVFSSQDDFTCVGNTRYNPDTFSFTINPNPEQLRLFNDKLVYTEKVRMRSSELSAVVFSFSTSFTFSITQQEVQSSRRSGWLEHCPGFVFSLSSENNETIYAGHPDPDINIFGVEFDTYNSYVDQDPSDNHIGVDINGPKSFYTYNLCGDQRTSCAFPWTGQNYTAWINYDGQTKSLEIWFANGELKPTGAGLIKVPNFDLTDVIGEYMYILFTGNAGPFLDTWEIFSLNFTTSYSTPLPTHELLFKRTALLVGAVCGAAILITVCFLGYWGINWEHHSKASSKLALNLPTELRRFSFKELKKATKSFHESTLLGKGGSGSVYKGVLTESGKVVAVKRLQHDSEHVEREFLAEVSTISQVRHRNLVRLLGWCHEDPHFMLVFDYLSNGSLDEWLFPSRRRDPGDPKYKRFAVLPWELRFFILAGVAAAVEYLHGEWVQCVLHRDIKSSNVMLDADFNPHLADFGLARLIDHEKLEKTTLMAGTLGYMAPEMHYTGKATKESDIYSFGILMLEVVCGRKPINVHIEDPDENFLLVQTVWRAYQGGNILSAVDPELLTLHQLNTSTVASHSSVLTNPMCKPEPFAADAALKVRDVERRIAPLLHLGLQCCLSDPESRPSMRVVKQSILQLEGSIAEDTMTILNSMPPLPSPIPDDGSLPHAPEWIVMATEVAGEASFKPGSETMSVLRRRF